jgi:hypothetical protein
MSSNEQSNQPRNTNTLQAALLSRFGFPADVEVGNADEVKETIGLLLLIDVAESLHELKPLAKIIVEKAKLEAQRDTERKVAEDARDAADEAVVMPSKAAAIAQLEKEFGKDVVDVVLAFSGEYSSLSSITRELQVEKARRDKAASKPADAGDASADEDEDDDDLPDSGGLLGRLGRGRRRG